MPELRELYRESARAAFADSLVRSPSLQWEDDDADDEDEEEFEDDEEDFDEDDDVDDEEEDEDVGNE